MVERNLGTKEEELLKLHEEKMRLQREAKDQASSLSNLEVRCAFKGNHLCFMLIGIVSDVLPLLGSALQ